VTHPRGDIAEAAIRALASDFDPGAVAAIVDDLLARKAVTRELGSGPLPPPIGALIDGEFAIAREQWPREQWQPAATTIAAADALFRRRVGR
jgi:hypothetical protein